ncbi:GNAT family N-acetyltransferase [Paraburkholderia sp. PGU16]|uniref:GNAT family N-acetyltransferase n=1 Tax=Paraburkholderia largidicola TaxID=3014751 RepID=A0A7I8BXG0_9BURK|nr:GNAT family N-acetyltransferase [Paraburkholderia sp. PGU16]BCF93059.1 GNAT family N-acetyltransferase [Paraburkholderia sp. PGU16]BEU26234.1 GNAT family N-acetyltransferase [Paraburkholderia sp. 22B1P]GJH32681.1 GNAT family N-acetyltransferase [Paraburkholderia hospita]
MSSTAHRSTQANLDRPIWTALTTRQAHLGPGDALARRYHPDVAPFAALGSDTPAAYEALHRLLQPHEQVALLSLEPLAGIDTLQVDHVGTLHQMVSTRDETGSQENLDVLRLGNADAKEMLALAQKTKPGPFSTRTHEMGNYIGVRDQGRLVAMAGERLCLDGYVEISAVCVDDDWRGKGLAGRLINILRKEITQRGATPFLHVFSHNTTAISLYERLGFELRREFVLNRIGHADAGVNTARHI